MYRRVLLKLSGEMLMGDQKFGIDQEACRRLAVALKGLRKQGWEIGVVIGGGNLFRGVRIKSTMLERTPADHMGMLATLMNGTALQQALASIGSEATVMSALECPKVAEAFHWGKALNHLSQGTIVIFVGGTGNPYFTTDTAAALRASEIHAEVLLKATKVDGVYNKDPMEHPDAVKYDTLSYSDALAEDLQVMDGTAIALCRSNQIPIYVFNMELLLNHELVSTLKEGKKGTLVKGD